VSSLVEIARRRLSLSTHRVRSLPVVVLMPHSRCNCRCVMCDIWKANADRRELTRDDLVRHLDAFRRFRVRWVVLSGGEALLHSGLFALCELLKEELGCRVTLLSTGLLLRSHAAAVTRWCDEVIVSLDGSRDVHDAIRRVPRAYDELANGVAALREVDPAYRVTGRSVVQRLSFRDLPRTIDAARELGLDQISFLAADVSSEAFNRAAPWTGARVAEVALDLAEAREFERLLEDTFASHAEDFASGFVAESPEKMRRLGRYYLALNGRGDFPETVCNAPWVSAVIEADGAVRPCFFHAAYGNVRERPFSEILNSPEAIAFRRRLDMARDPICRKCVCSLKL
jgi:MoaA/NifB/PqqE/SkfB family radical SAM enzyme